MEIWQTLQQWVILDIPASRWFLAFILLAITIAVQRYLIKGFHHITHAITAHTETPLDDLLLTAAEKPASWLILMLGLMVSMHMLNPPSETFPLVDIADKAARLAVIALGSWFTWRLIDGFSAYFSARAAHTHTALDDQLVPFMSKTLKIFLVFTLILVLAQNMGYSISGLIASLGIGGLAIAMAAKDTIANIFGSIMILVDRPFTIGDWIKTKEFEGVVEEVGFRSTRIRTFAKTLVNVPNSQLANMVIDNIDAMPKRRVKMRIGITYDTTPEQMQQAITSIENVLKNHVGVDQTFSLVKFDAFEDSSLSIFLYYFTKSTHWDEYLQVRQEINLEIMQALEKLKLEFAFPSRSLYLHDMDKHPTTKKKSKTQ
ncbi:MAG: mechanosensitive ion channel family protein [Mariprofundaceae bacterium]|nr:mechanosensitive ion channel family protein [Mariprofundaceae bacterium]